MAKPRIHFVTEEHYEDLLRLGKLNLPIKTIADHFNCSYQTLSTSEVAMGIVRSGWSWYRARIEQELFDFATATVNDIEDPAERMSVRSQKLTALKQIHTVLNKDPFIPPAEIEKVRRMSDEELQEELAKVFEQNAKVLTPVENGSRKTSK